MKQAVVGQAPHPGPSPSQIDPIAEASATCEPKRIAKKRKVLVSKAPSSVAPRSHANSLPRAKGGEENRRGWPKL
ncbi:hypothetical protein BHE74_00047792 [Ensete ventricosum]|nr:hypothetical protein BHE74_00047792 [Ensete ventricosum]